MSTLPYFTLGNEKGLILLNRIFITIRLGNNGILKRNCVKLKSFSTPVSTNPQSACIQKDESHTTHTLYVAS